MKITTEDIQVGFHARQILKGISIESKDKELVGIIGPNGSGKSTLLKCIYRILKPDAGAVYLDGEELHSMSVKSSARKMAVVAQHNYYNFDFTVREVVLMGRAPHKKTLERDNAKDYQIVDEALKTVQMETFADRTFSTLSGGEQQRVILARALAQQTPALILDEPTNHLDITHQIMLMELVKKLNVTVISAIHDLNIAAAYCDKIYVLKDKEYEEGTWDYQVIFHELSHCLRDSHYTDEDGNKVYIQFAGLNYYDVPNAEAINSLFAVSLFDYEENDIAYQMQSNAHKIMIECMDNYSLDDYVNHSLGYYAKQLDEYNQDDNYATTILTLMDEQYHDYYDEKTAENPEKYYPIYDYISNMYLGKHLKAGMSQEEARGIMDEMLEKLLFDVPEEYHIDRDHFYEYLEKYYTEKFSAA